MKGNEAVAEAAILSGCRHYFGYPITPQNEIAAYMSRRMPKVGGVFLQAESEIAAANMLIGASAAGVRAFTTSSSPGISLKAEALSYIAGCDIPGVLVNVQRGGPGLGTIQPSQADYFQAVKAGGGGHGDYRMIVLAPNSVQEMADFTMDAFDLADKYTMGVMVLCDGLLGQMMEPVVFDKNRIPPESKKDWAVSAESDKRPKRIITSLYLQAEDNEAANKKRFVKYAEVEATQAKWEEYLTDDADVIISAYGIAARVARNAVDTARAQGIKAGLLRPITLWPFPKAALLKTADKVKGFVVVEMNMGQMKEDVLLAINCKKPVSGVNRPGGSVPEPDEIVEAVIKIDKQERVL
jgi:2-oxoglutarate ferredoxin oxidoreductase subunit alpha